MANGTIEENRKSNVRIYTVGGNEGLRIRLANTNDNQMFFLINSRGDALVVYTAPSVNQVDVSVVHKSHDGDIVGIYNNGSIYIGIKFGSVYGTQGWNVYGVDNPSLGFTVERASMPS